MKKIKSTSHHLILNTNNWIGKYFILSCMLIYSIGLNAQKETYSINELVQISNDLYANSEHAKADSVNIAIKYLWQLQVNGEIKETDQISVEKIKANKEHWDYNLLLLDSKKAVNADDKAKSDSISKVIDAEYSHLTKKDFEYYIASGTKKHYLDIDRSGAIAQSLIAESLLPKDHPLYLHKMRIILGIRAESYFQSGEKEKAYEYGLQKLAIVKQLKSKEMIIKTHYFIAMYLTDLQRLDEALDHYLIANKMAKEDEKFVHLYKASLMNIGIVYGRLAEKTQKQVYFDSLEYFFKAYEARIPTKDSILLSNFNANMAEMYRMLKKHDVAKSYVKKSFNILHQANVSQWDVWKNAYSTNFRIHNDLQQSDSIILSALEFSDKVVGMYSVKIDKELDELRFSLEQECLLREEKQNQEIETQTAKNNTYLAVTIGTLIALALLSALLYQNFQKRKKEQELFGIKQQLLRTQMSPHFTFNTLANIKALINQEENKTASKYLNKFSNLLRISLDNSIENAVALDKEIEAIKLYLDLQKIRFEDSFDYHIDITLANPEEYTIPTMLIQPFVENCFKHAFKGIDYKGMIEIKLFKKERALICLIVDNGSGIEKEKENKGDRSLSYSITDRRLKLLGGQFDTKGKLTLKNREEQKGALVEIALPYRLD